MESPPSSSSWPVLLEQVEGQTAGSGGGAGRARNGKPIPRATIQWIGRQISQNRSSQVFFSLPPLPPSLTSLPESAYFSFLLQFQSLILSDKTTSSSTQLFQALELWTQAHTDLTHSQGLAISANSAVPIRKRAAPRAPRDILPLWLLPCTVFYVTYRIY